MGAGDARYVGEGGLVCGEGVRTVGRNLLEEDGRAALELARVRRLERDLQLATPQHELRHLLLQGALWQWNREWRGASAVRGGWPSEVAEEEADEGGVGALRLRHL